MIGVERVFALYGQMGLSEEETIDWYERKIEKALPLMQTDIAREMGKKDLEYQQHPGYYQPPPQQYQYPPQPPPPGTPLLPNSSYINMRYDQRPTKKAGSALEPQLSNSPSSRKSVTGHFPRHSLQWTHFSVRISTIFLSLRKSAEC